MARKQQKKAEPKAVKVEAETLGPHKVVDAKIAAERALGSQRRPPAVQ